MKGLNVSSIRELIGDCNRSIQDANNQLLEVDEKIDEFNLLLSSDDADKYELNLKLNSLLLKKDVLKSDIISYEEKINVCNKLLYDFALNSILSNDELLDRVSNQVIELKNEEIDVLSRENDFYSNELNLRKKCCSLYSFKGRNYMFESLISTPISREQYVKYFILELKDSGLLDSIFDLIRKYDSDLSSYIDLFNNINVDSDIDVFFDEHSIKGDWKKFLSCLKFYSEVLENYKFFQKLEDLSSNSSLFNFDEEVYFPLFKTCTRDDIIKYYENLENVDLKNYISKFDLNNLSALDVYCIIYKLNNSHKFILKNDNFISNNDQEIYKLSKIISINKRAIDGDKKIVDGLNSNNKYNSLLKYFGGLFLHQNYLPIDFHSNLIVDDINKVVVNYNAVEIEKNKVIDMVKCYEDGPLFSLFSEFGADKFNFKIGDVELSVDVLKRIVMDVNNYNLNIRRKKNEFSDLLSVIECLNKKIESSKKEYDDYVSNRDNIIFTNKKGNVVKNKFLRFFFKFFKQYKDNVSSFEDNKSFLESNLNEFKCRYKEECDKLNITREYLDKITKAKDDYITENNNSYSGIVDKAMRYNTYLENNGYDMYSNYLHLKKSLDDKCSEIDNLKKLYQARLSELLCISNLPNSYVNNINSIIDNDDVVKVDYIDKKYTDYFSLIYDRYKENDFVFNDLVNNNYDYKMDSDEAIYGLIGKIKKKFR